MKHQLIRILFFSLVAIFAMSSGSSNETTNAPSAAGASNAEVEITNITVGSKDNLGRYTVKISVKVKNLDYDEYVKMIGVKWGTVKSNPSNRDSRSNESSTTFTCAWHSQTTYYVTPFFKTNKTSGEVTGTTLSKRTP